MHIGGVCILASILVAALAVLPQVGRSQQETPPNVSDVDSLRDAALARIHRLDSFVARRNAEYRETRSAVLSSTRYVHVREGMFHLLVETPLADEARRAAHTASVALEATTGDDLRDRISRRLPMIGVDTQRVRLGVLRSIWVAADTGKASLSPMRVGMVGARGAGAAVIAGRLVTLTEELAAVGMDSALGAWLRVEQIPLAPRPMYRWQQAYIELVSTAAVSLRACHRRDREGCLTSLGLAAAGQTGLNAWYAPEDYPDLLRRVDIARDDSLGRANATVCRRHGDAPSCAIAVSHIPPAFILPPIPPATRELFLAEILRMGGVDSYARFRAAKGSLRERFAVAAGAPLDSVVDRWYARVVAAKPESMAASPGVVLITCGWCLMLGAVAITRRLPS